MRDVHAHQGAVVNIYEQGDLPYEKRDQRITCVFTESERAALEKRAARRGFQNLSVYLRHLIAIGSHYERVENLTLGEIVRQKNF